MKLFLLLAVVCLSGCATASKLAIAPAQEVDIAPGSYIVDGKQTSVVWDETYQIKNGFVYPNGTGFRLEPLIGADLVGLNASTWAGLRFVHLENIGLDFGFDRNNFTCGIDWLWHDIVVGPNIAFPYDLTPSHFGAKLAVIF